MNEDTEPDPMNLSDFDLEQEMRDLYHNPGTGYRSIESLYKKVKNDGFDVSHEQVKRLPTNARHLHKNISKGRTRIGKEKIS